MSIGQVIHAYQAHGFKIKAILADGQFKHIQQLIKKKGNTLNICTTNEQVPEIEMYIRPVKETVRSIATILSLKRVPTMTNCGNGLRLCILVKQFSRQSWCTHNNKSKSNNDRTENNT